MIQNFQNYDVFFFGGGGVKIFKITTSFLGRGHQKYDIVRYGGRGGQKTRKKVRRLLWTAPKLNEDIVLFLSLNTVITCVTVQFIAPK